MLGAWRYHPENRLWRFINGPVAVLLTFIAVLAGDIVLRSADLRDTLSVYQGMLGRNGRGGIWPAWELLVLALLRDCMIDAEHAGDPR